MFCLLNCTVLDDGFSPFRLNCKRKPNIFTLTSFFPATQLGGAALWLFSHFFPGQIVFVTHGMLEEMLLSHWRSPGCGGHGPCHQPQCTYTDRHARTHTHGRIHPHKRKAIHHRRGTSKPFYSINTPPPPHPLPDSQT